MFIPLLRSVLPVLVVANTLLAADLSIRLQGNAEPATRKRMRYQCDANGPKLGLPPGPFEVEYINAGANSLAVLPIGGQSLIFANVLSGSGARYAAKQLIWWDAGGRGVSLNSDTDKVQSFCKGAK